MTADEVKTLLEQAAADVDLLQRMLPPGICKAFADLIGAQNAMLISNVLPGATAGGVQQIMDGLGGAFATLGKLEEEGRLDQIVKVLRALEDRRILLWIAGRLVGGRMISQHQEDLLSGLLDRQQDNP